MRQNSKWMAMLVFAVPCFAQAAMNRPYSGGKFMLELDGKNIGWVKSFEGGNAIQTPMVRGSRADKFPDKSPGPLKYEEATLSLPLPTERTLWDAVNTWFGMVPSTPKSIALVATDTNFREKSRIGFDNAQVTAVELSTLDASAKQNALVKLKVAPSRTTEKASSGTSKVGAELNTTAKLLSASNFRFTIDGIASGRISRIEPIRITRAANGTPEYANLVVSVMESDIDPWQTWADQTMDGKSVEHNGRLELLNANLTDVLFTVTFEGLGIVRLVPDRFESNNTAARNVRAELYVEKITFVPSAG
jgi:hypothetical protein